MPQLEVIFMPSEWFAVWHEVLFKFGDSCSSLKVKHRPHKLFPELFLTLEWSTGRTLGKLGFVNEWRARALWQHFITGVTFSITQVCLIHPVSVTWKWRCNSLHVGLGSFPPSWDNVPLLSFSAALREPKQLASVLLFHISLPSLYQLSTGSSFWTELSCHHLEETLPDCCSLFLALVHTRPSHPRCLTGPLVAV